MAPATIGRIVGRHADGRQPDQRLPGAVDVVDAPAAEPASVGLLRAADVGHGPIDGRIAHAAAQLAQRFQHAAGQVGRARVDHGVVVGERHVAEELAVVVAVERPPAAVAFCMASIQRSPRSMAATVVLHRVDPLLRLVRSARRVDAASRNSGGKASCGRARRRTASAAPSAPWPCRRSRDRSRWRTRSTSRPARRRPSPPNRRGRRSARSKQPVDRLADRPDCRAARRWPPAPARAIAVSQTGDLQGCKPGRAGFVVLDAPGLQAAGGSTAPRGCRRR